MDTLQKQIDLARRRLITQQFLAVLPWCWCLAFALAAIAIAASRVWPLGLDDQIWTTSWLGGAAAAGLLLAGVVTWLRRKSRFDAAVEIDHRFELRERVSSALALGDEQLNSQVGQALVADAARRLDRLDVSERFSVKLGRRAWLPLLPAAIAFGLALFVDSRGTDNPAEAKITPAQAQQQIKKSAEALQRKLAERRKEAREKGLLDAEGIFKKLEEGTKSLGEKQTAERDQALVKLNDLAKDLQQRRNSLGANDQFKQQLNNLKDLQRGPADKLGQSLKNGDLKQAQDELKKLKDKLASGKLEEKEKEALQQQLDQMKQALQKAADAHQAAKEDLQKQIEEKKAQGKTDEASKLQQQLDKLAQQDKRMGQLQDMAKQLDKAAQAMQKGDTQAAEQALDQLSEQVSSLQKENDELDLINDALDQIAQAKDSMKCKECAGDGCEACEGNGGKGKKNGPPGKGMGEGQGKGDRPEEKTKTGFYDSKVKQNVGKGAAVVTDMIEGPNRKGQVAEAIKAEFEAAEQQQSDPLAGQRLPRDYRDHAQKYFDSLREGKK